MHLVIKRKSYIPTVVIVIIFVFGILSSKMMNLRLCTRTDSSFLSRLRGPLKSDDPELIERVKTNWLKPPTNIKYISTLQDKNKSITRSLTWEFINKNVQRFFNDTYNGFFVEAGALDGEVLSNTIWLEVYKNWTGLLVEPDPVNYKAMMKKNRRTWTSNTCLSTDSYPKESILIQLSKEEQFPIKKIFNKGLSYEMKRGTNAFEKNDDFQKSYLTVQCVPLETLLLALHVTVVDFLSLDIQGGEWEILKQFPFHKIKLRALVVEYYTSSQGQINEEFIRFMVKKGYVLVDTSFEPDYFFVLIDDPHWFNQI